jgi:hypothetical protein
MLSPLNNFEHGLVGIPFESIYSRKINGLSPLEELSTLIFQYRIRKIQQLAIWENEKETLD